MVPSYSRTFVRLWLWSFAAMTVQIEPLRREDLPEVLAIEAGSFAVPWTEEMFEK